MRQPFAVHAEQLGWELARRRHRVILHTDDPQTVDSFVARGMARFAAERPHARSPVIEVHSTFTEKRFFDGIRGVEVRQVPYHHVSDAGFDRLGARAGGVALSDGVIVVAGSDGTSRVGYLAKDLRKPLVPIAAFGGAGETIWKQSEALLLSKPEIGRQLPALTLLGEPRRWAADVADVLAALQGDHTYFLSYSHENGVVADHFEVLLRRRGKNVLRDEDNIRIAQELDPRIDDLIARANTFVLLWSLASDNGTWCKKELERAREFRARSGSPARIAIVRIDPHPVPPDWAVALFGVGETRDQRTKVVWELVGGEGPDDD